MTSLPFSRGGIQAMSFSMLPSRKNPATQAIAPKIKGLRMLAVKSKKPLRKKMNTQVAATKYAT